MNAKWLLDVVRSFESGPNLTEAERRDLKSLIEALESISAAKLTDVAEAIRAYAPASGQDRAPTRKGRRRVSKSISEITQLLRESYGNDRAFENAVELAADSDLTKADLTNVYCGLFDTKKVFPKSKTRPDILDAIRHERFARVRFSS